ncbi:hypothetical protein NKH09_15925 [Mesorhizobium sp. M1339]|uniref:hypothetical protein n=1 Tax=Mesorhizobium sp. M1339 TaxID=2957086 RepID=UPI00333CA6CA
MARDTIISQEKQYPVKVSAVNDAPDGAAVFLSFKTDAAKRGNRWLIEIDVEDFAEIIAAMVKADPFAAALAYQEASALKTP